MHNKISKRFKTFLNLMTAFVFLSVFFLCSTKAYADSLSVPIKVKQIISINSPYAKPKDSFDYRMEAVNKDAPLPDGKSETYTFSLNGDEEKQFNIEYQKPGDYTYKIYQLKNNDIKNVIQDETVYTISIKIIERDGNLLRDLIIIKNSSGKKVEEIIFHNQYKIEDTDRPEEPGDTDKPDKPGDSDNTEKPGDTNKPGKPGDTDKPGEDEILKIVFDANGGKFKDGSTKKVLFYKKGEEITIVKAPIREGYRFDYWKGSKYYPGDKYLVTEDHKFVAQWIKEDKVSKPGENTQKPSDRPSSNTKTGVRELMVPIFLIMLLAMGLLILSKKRETKKK